MREIKFRAWDAEAKVMKSFDLYQTNHLPNYGYPVMQFTGLKDKNGTEIYEGDIVKSWNLTNEFKEPDICEVVWDRNFYATKRINGGGSTGLHISDGDFGVEVIGNIYENPDLLK